MDCFSNAHYHFIQCGQYQFTYFLTSCLKKMKSFGVLDSLAIYMAHKLDFNESVSIYVQTDAK